MDLSSEGRGWQACAESVGQSTQRQSATTASYGSSVVPGDVFALHPCPEKLLQVTAFWVGASPLTFYYYYTFKCMALILCRLVWCAASESDRARALSIEFRHLGGA
eukprot:4490168-Amphidinium_carterae.1